MFETKKDLTNFLVEVRTLNESNKRVLENFRNMKKLIDDSTRSNQQLIEFFEQKQERLLKENSIKSKSEVEITRKSLSDIFNIESMNLVIAENISRRISILIKAITIGDIVEENYSIYEKMSESEFKEAMSNNLYNTIKKRVSVENIGLVDYNSLFNSKSDDEGESN